MEVYRSMFGILKLKNVQSIIIVHLIAKIGFQANDGVTNLKLLDKGFSQEDLALTVLIDFPFEISLGYYAGRWSTAYPAMHVWCWAFIGRLMAAVIAQGVVMIFPKDGVQTWYLLTVIMSHIFSTFTNTVMFVAISAFHAKISDPLIGGTYMTLLATYVLSLPLNHLVPRGYPPCLYYTISQTFSEPFDQTNNPFHSFSKQRLQPRRYLSPLLHPKTRRLLHPRHLPPSRRTPQGPLHPQRRPHHDPVLLRPRSAETSLRRWGRFVRYLP